LAGSSSSSCNKLQKEEVRTHQPTSTKEEAKVICSLCWRLVGLEIRDGDEISLVAWLAVFFSNGMREANGHLSGPETKFFKSCEHANVNGVVLEAMRKPVLHHY
jgi:hypothetical protein